MEQAARVDQAPPQDFDVIVAGTGGGGLVAALAARDRGLRPLVIEKMSIAGGSTALSSGVVWLPANPLMRQAGVDDSVEKSLRYLEEIIGDRGPASSPERRRSYVEGAGEMYDFLTQRCGVTFRYCDGWPDYWPEAPGGQPRGRAVDAVTFDARTLGPLQQRLPPNRYPLLLRGVEAAGIYRALRTVEGKVSLSKAAARTVRSKLRGGQHVTMGKALIGHLLAAVQRSGTPIWFESAIAELIVEQGAIRGAVIERNGQRQTVRTRGGVILATGGYGRNAELRAQNGTYPDGASWSSAQPGDTGDGYRLVTSQRAITAELDMAWWLPVAVTAEGRPSHVVYERTLPHSLMVDGEAQRFVNEAADYTHVGLAMLRKPAIPAWLIIDSRHRNNYVFAMKPPRRTPQQWIDSNFLIKADSIRALASRCKLNEDALVATVDRFNKFARVGVDDDFQRGASAYNRYFADPSNKPNPSLGTVERGPFYAQELYPGDTSTSGGALTDGNGRVINEDHDFVEGLYAVGNTAATVFGDKYPGAGASIGQSMVFGYRAANFVASAVYQRV